MDKFLVLINDLKEKLLLINQEIDIKNNQVSEIKVNYDKVLNEENSIKSKLKEVTDKIRVINNYKRLTLPYKQKCFKKTFKTILFEYIIFLLINTVALISSLNISSVVMNFGLALLILQTININVRIYFDETREYWDMKSQNNYTELKKQENEITLELVKKQEQVKIIKEELEVLLNDIQNLKMQQSELSDIILGINEKREAIIAPLEEKLNYEYEKDNSLLLIRTKKKKEGV